MVTSSTGGVISSQSFDPWGKVLSGGNVTQTRLNYTGQRLDDTGLLYYHARYYDPVLGRFTSPDSIVPDVPNSKLTVDFHESGFISSVNGENAQVLQKGFWFQLDCQSRKNAVKPNGPSTPQALNRFAYVLNNPVKSSDPHGHGLPPSYGNVPLIPPVWVKDTRSFISWLKGISNDMIKSGRVLTKAEADKIVALAREYGVGSRILLDPPHEEVASRNPLVRTNPHLGVDGVQDIHLPVEEDYDNPDVGNRPGYDNWRSGRGVKGPSDADEPNPNEPPLEGTGNGEVPGSPGAPGLGGDVGFEPGMGGGGNPVKDDGLANIVLTSYGR